MPRGKARSDETKAQVMAALLAGQGISEVARQYSLPSGTVRTWKRQLTPEKLNEIKHKKEERGEELDNLIYTYLAANLRALKVQTEVAGDAEYLRKQPASELATLHGVMVDKAIRILEAAERANGFGQTEEASPPA